MTDTTRDATPLDLLADRPQADADDGDLARRMGRDAQRVASGELSEAAFYDRYHDAVLDRFGFDHRPGGGDR
jgi:molybdopterin-containing oxidoreductase family iron-sulfur binding subunit